MSQRPWPQREARTVFLRVPDGDWLAVKRGRKTEFRANGRATSKPGLVKAPTPVVAYAVRRGRHESQLMALEALWTEELRAISDESLAREGFGSFAEFRRYWTLRTNRPFRPLDTIWCFRLRPWRPGDERELGAALVERLYGEHLVRRP